MTLYHRPFKEGTIVVNVIVVSSKSQIYFWVPRDHIFRLQCTYMHTEYIQLRYTYCNFKVIKCFTVLVSLVGVRLCAVFSLTDPV